MGFEPAKHHRLIIDELEKVCRGETENLLIFAPPGSAKSTYVTQLFIAWYLANQPDHKVLFATHSVEFAERWGRRIRNDLQDNSLVLGVEPDQSNQAAARWALKTGGELYGVGAGVGISGFRADLGVIDDPFGSREDAWSETVRLKRWEWYTSDFSARLKPNARRVIMHTRWHEEDIAGRVLEQVKKGIVKARVISIPAIAGETDVLGRKAGEYLWDEPDGYDYGKYLRQRQREESPMMWSALYQQEPAPEDGDFFKAEWLIDYKGDQPKLETLQVYGASDYAVTQDGGDWTVHGVIGIDPNGDMHLLDVWRKQTTPDKWIDTFCDLVRKYRPLEWAEETGQIKSGIGPFRDKRMMERSAYVACTAFPTRGDKAVRATSMRGRMAQRGLYVDHAAPWFTAFRSELLSFPAGKHDDQVDMIGLLGQLLDNMVDGVLPKPQQPPDNPSGYSEVDQFDSEELSAMDML